MEKERKKISNPVRNKFLSGANGVKKGICKRKTKYFGMITVTDKGQIAIPAELRKEYAIEKGDKLIIVRRNDNKGFNLLKSEVIKDFIEKISRD
ncbi:MAG: AbrB/MazE/SpoVT family DNA-binding domain-containing protein [Patescibacteria group bacterium]|nr:AbrB/MazE/SpoVT family DNA-binding domain-containing protein [Patescibacteria group bacterium]MDD5294830.1 AbrB/MazE/SpoVT family DNA-binding domain-containing protein [Patescibacteria group bacterium]MDD5554734.1 AbrB/MazE/SpoVT family DNA-binding domain-containing protein [Patescibacteria group bacterium]